MKLPMKGIITKGALPKALEDDEVRHKQWNTKAAYL